MRRGLGYHNRRSPFLVGSGPAPTGYWIETLTSTVSSSDVLLGRNIGVDSSGNSYSIGIYNNAVPDITNDYYFVVSKYNSNGAIQWQKLLTDSNTNVSCWNGAVDSSGNVYVVGQDNFPNCIAFKLNSSGVLQWQKTLGDNIWFNQFIGVALDSSGNIYVGGETTTYSSGNAGDFLIAKYNSSGTLQFQNQLYDPSSAVYDDVWAIPVDSSGNYYPVGTAGYVVGFVAKFNSSNVLQWQKSFTPADPSNHFIIFYSSCVDSSGNIYCCGNYQDNASNINYGVIVKINSSGAIVWQRYVGNAPYDVTFFYISIDSSNNLYVAGYGSTATSFVTYIVKYNSSGVLQWQRSLSDSIGQFGIGIAVDSSGNYYVTGRDNNFLPSSSLTFKLPTDGTRTGTYGSYTYAASSLVDSAGDMYVNNATYPTSNPGLDDATGPLTMTVPTFTSTVTIV